MASQYNDPPAPQTEVATNANDNGTAHIGPYVDQDITKRNVVETAAAVKPAKSGSATLGNTRRYYTEDGDGEGAEEIANTASHADATPPVRSPNSWRTGRDPYKVNGLDSYLNNQG